MAPKKGKKSKKGTKEVAQESTAVLWLMDKTGFNKKELGDLMDKFKSIAADKRTQGKGKKKIEIVSECGGGDDKISKDEFVKYFSDIMKVKTKQAETLFKVADTTGDGFIEYREFLSLMSILYKGTPEQKLEFAFRTYDEDNSGDIDREEMNKMLTNTLTIDDPTEKAAKVEELLFKAFITMDTDGNGRISLEEAKAAFAKDQEVLATYFGQNLVDMEDLIQ